MFDEGLVDLATWKQASSKSGIKQAEETDYLPLDSEGPAVELEMENESLKKQIASLQRLQRASFEQLAKQRKEIEFLVDEQTENDNQRLRPSGIKPPWEEDDPPFRDDAESMEREHTTNDGEADTNLRVNGDMAADEDSQDDTDTDMDTDSEVDL